MSDQNNVTQVNFSPTIFDVSMLYRHGLEFGKGWAMRFLIDRKLALSWTERLHDYFYSKFFL